MAHTSVPSALTDTFNPYPDSASETPYTAEADAGEFFSTLLDIINPLQHIPLVSNLYREITGDEIAPAARMVGGAVFGGPIGFASASANVLLEQASGDDLLGHAVALFSDDTTPPTENMAAATAAASDTPENPGSASLKAAAEIEENAIVWAGPRVIPQFARPNNTDVIQQVAQNSNTFEAGEEATTTAADNAWLTESRTTAQANLAARETGQVVPLASPQPWVATAMLEALDKYDALARTRSEGDLNRPADNSGEDQDDDR